MKVLIDSSAWIDFLNGAATEQAAAVRELLRDERLTPCVCGVVVAEVLQGLRRPGEPARVRAILADLELCEPRGFASYARAAELFRRLRERGVTVRSTIDCLIAVVAEEHDAALLARDRDLDAVLASGGVDVRAWSGSA